MRSLIAKYIVKPFKSFPYLGRFRFWCLYLSYKITGWHIRDVEWDFVLDYLPKLDKWQASKVLDVGCSRNLFCHEVISRGYKLYGVDLEKPGFEYPGSFLLWDIRTKNKMLSNFDFVTCISVLEHIEQGKNDALYQMINCLSVGGRLLITIPTKDFAQGHPWDGFTRKEFENILPNNCKISNCIEKKGQFCMAIERTE